MSGEHDLTLFYFRRSCRALYTANQTLTCDSLDFLLPRTGSHPTTRDKHGADVIKAVTPAVLLLLIFTFFTVCRIHSVAVRNRQQKMEEENEADSLGNGGSKMTSADNHKSTIASSLGRAIALVMTNVS